MGQEILTTTNSRIELLSATIAKKHVVKAWEGRWQPFDVTRPSTPPLPGASVSAKHQKSERALSSSPRP
ncbi:hypothetical protein J6590_035891 [Homalodisca vitripennis]|nr:hypothetical protein J6590_035891 [Homalodisca vitripennis]